MTLTQKFASISPEQREKFKALKDATALDAFLTENSLALTDEEKAQAIEYFSSGKLPLADEELENVAGGCGIDYSDKCNVCNGSFSFTRKGDVIQVFCSKCNKIFTACPVCNAIWRVDIYAPTQYGPIVTYQCSNGHRFTFYGKSL